MKHLLTLPFIPLTLQAFSQINDSTATKTNSYQYSAPSNTYQTNSLSSFTGAKQPRIIMRDNISFTTYNLQFTPLENEILDLEVIESNALVKRDTAILKKLWARDFTADDKPENKILHVGGNPIPYYTVVSRLIEKFTYMGDIVFTSGYEYSQKLRRDGSLEEMITVEFFHTWTRKYGMWKITTKTHSDPIK